MLQGGHVSAEFAGFLHERTEGVPLAVEESVRLMGDRADLSFRRGAWARRHLADIEVPPTVRDAVLERAGRLGPARRRCCGPRRCSPSRLRSRCWRRSAGLAAGGAGRACARRWAAGCWRGWAAGMVSFRHVLAGRAVYEAIPAPERRRAAPAGGAGAGRAVAAAGGPAGPALPRGRRHRQWCRYGEQAADLALAAGDEATAATLLHDLVIDAGLSAGAVIRLTRKIPFIALTGYAPSSDLVRSLRSVLDGGALTPAERAEAGCQLGRILLHAGECEAAAAELERAIPGLAHRPVEAARAMLRLGWPS